MAGLAATRTGPKPVAHTNIRLTAKPLILRSLMLIAPTVANMLALLPRLSLTSLESCTSPCGASCSGSISPIIALACSMPCLLKCFVPTS
eukprot:5323498-Amphidinium_carterae.1